MFRRKLRTLLTIVGISIGILAMVVMGGIAEKLNLLVDGGTKYYKDKVTVSGEGLGFIGSPMTLSKKSELENIEGVAAVFGETYSTLEKDLSTVNFGPPASITSTQDGSEPYESFVLTLSKGRKLNPDDTKKAVIGSDLVQKLNAKVGSIIKVRDEDFEVVGIYEKTFSTPDTTVSVPFKDGQNIMIEDQPEIIKQSVKSSEIVYDFVVYPKPGVDPNQLADKIKAEVDGVSTIGPKSFQDQVTSSVKIFSSIIYGIGAISLLVGSLSIINTMTMSISERTKEIGVKKAVGAKSSSIMTEYLTEAGIIGLVGGLIGVSLGVLIANSINSILEKTGDRIFLMSPRLLIGSLIFSIILGIVAGIYPAFHATRINIVKALREE